MTIHDAVTPPIPRIADLPMPSDGNLSVVPGTPETGHVTELSYFWGRDLAAICRVGASLYRMLRDDDASATREFRFGGMTEIGTWLIGRQLLVAKPPAEQSFAYGDDHVVGVTLTSYEKLLELSNNSLESTRPCSPPRQSCSGPAIFTAPSWC